MQRNLLVNNFMKDQIDLPNFGGSGNLQSRNNNVFTPMESTSMESERMMMKDKNG